MKLKKVSVFLLVVVLLISNLGGIALAKNETDVKVYRVKEIVLPLSATYDPRVEGLRMRKTPGIDGIVVGLLYPGDYISVQHGGDIIYKDGYEWVWGTKQSDGLSGWVVLSYLEEIG